jgi:hypothetical protein
VQQKRNTLANLLTMLNLEELSLVDRPANPLAMAPLYKRHTPNGDEMTKLPEDEMVAKADLDTAKDENEVLRKALIDNDFIITVEGVSKKAPVEQIEVEGEMINKSDIPAPVLKALEAAKVEKAEVALAKKAEELLPNVSKEHAVKLVKSFADDEDLMEFLSAVDAMFAGTMEELGKADVDGEMSDPQKKLDKMVEAVKADKSVTKEQAYAEVSKTAEGIALINKLYKKED